jgi:hypothetical protein
MPALRDSAAPVIILGVRRLAARAPQPSNRLKLLRLLAVQLELRFLLGEFQVFRSEQD